MKGCAITLPYVDRKVSDALLQMNCVTAKGHILHHQFCLINVSHFVIT